MRALVATGETEEPVRLASIEEAPAASSQAVVAQRVISLNRGEGRALGRSAPGAVHGWDIAGVVVEPAADGSGPAGGTPVIGVARAGGGWAERVRVTGRDLAVIPDGLDLEAASTLPIAGLTALWTLSIAGPLIGRRVLITGAAGGVGRFAIQLARPGGAHVTAIASSEERGRGLVELGADEVLFENARDNRRFDLILESVGGESLAASLHRVVEDGFVVLFGNSSGANPVFDVEFHNRSRGAPLHAFNIMYELERRDAARDLGWLAGEMLSGRLDPQIALRASWRQAADVLKALAERRINGKAVLLVD